MSRNQRLGLVVLAVVVAVAAFVIAKSGAGNETARKPEQPAVQRVVIKQSEPVGGVRSIKVKQGDQVKLAVSVDSPQALHLHGYEIEQEAKPGKPAVFSFKAKNEGLFELESHTAEHAGLEPLMARLVVEPS